MSPLINYRLRHATSDDLDGCLALRQGAERDLAAAGIKQWTDSDVGRNVITEWIAGGHMFVVETAAHDVCGCLALAGPDQDFWRPEEAVQPALYLYKMIIRPDRRGSGLGDLLLDWASSRAEAAGARWLRLDCWRTNTALHQLWQSRGFELLDIRDHPIRKSGALFQRKAGTQLVPADADLHTRINLIDDTDPIRPAAIPLRTTADRYDPTGEAAIWNEAASIAAEVKLAGQAGTEGGWNVACEQIARALENRGREVRQANGMYYRVIDGRTAS